ncbi:MAG: gliding motility-associated C-terminal domain-containing protein [Flavipsychrobacter sp.]
MKYIPILLLLLSSQAFAQIQTNPTDTTCINTVVNMSNGTTGISHTWVMDTTDIAQYNTAAATASGTFAPVNNPVYSSMDYDNGNWYSFTTNYNNRDIIRLSYGANPNSTPTATNLGNFGFTGFLLEGVQIIRDPANGNWYGFFVNFNRLMRLDFGTSLGNNPTATFYSLSPDLAHAHQIGVAKYGTQWVGFVANRNGAITRLDFGTSITNAPTTTVLPKVGGYDNPCNFALHQQNGNWYMLVTSLTTPNISRLDFGTNIQNNSPTGTLLGNTGLQLPRTVAIFSDCNQLIAYVANESGNLIKLDFHNNITSTPTFSNMGALGVTNINSFVPFIYNGTQYLHITSYSSKGYHRKTLFTYPTFNSTVYYNPTLNYTFTTAGAKKITLLQNMGGFMGMQSHCSGIFIASGASNIDIIKDTTICQNDTLTLDASSSGGTTYIWNTGATTSSIKVTQANKYWVQASGGTLCGTASDTATISKAALPTVDLDSFINKCAGTQIKLENKNTNPSGATFLWSDATTAATNEFIGSPSKSGTYWLEVNNNGCIGADTVKIQIDPVPAVYLGPDTTICNSISYTLNAGPQDSGTIYQWNTNSADSAITLTQSGTYAVTVVNKFGCTVADTVVFNSVEGPKLDLGNDTTLCYGEEITLYAGITKVPVTYVWSDSSLKDRLKVKTPGQYTLYAFSSCGLARDDIYIDFYNCELWFPSAFTPNNDGRNDVAKVLGNITEVTNFELGIFNRWGNRVFYTIDINEGWDGSYKGKALSMDAFYYYIKYKFRGRDEIMKGSVTILR